MPSIGFQSGTLCRFRKRIIHTTGPVDKAEPTGRATRPYTPLCDSIDLFGRFLARRCDARQELAIAILNGALGHAVKFGTEAIQDIRFARQRRRLHAVRIHADFRKSSLRAWNDAEDTNGSGNRGRIGKNNIGRKRYPITAACGQIRHRNDDRNLFRLRRFNRQTDFFRRCDRTARRIHADHQSFQILIVERIVNEAADGVARCRSGAAFSIDDRTRNGHNANLRTSGCWTVARK